MQIVGLPRMISWPIHINTTVRGRYCDGHMSVQWHWIVWAALICLWLYQGHQIKAAWKL